jgi:hypothetical protein
MIRSETLTFGSDVEFFIAKEAPQAEKDRYGYNYNIRDIVPCVGLVEGTKEKPFRPDNWPKGFAIQEDNVMVEVNTPVSDSSNQFSHNQKMVRKLLRQYLKKIGYCLVTDRTYHEFSPKLLDSPQARTFGCDPDHDAYEGGIQRTNIPDFGGLRTCGGHIHIGGNFKCPDWVAVLFFELALYRAYGSSLVCPDSPRLQWYGRPGIFRPKEYGIEYRTLGNWWAGPDWNPYDLIKVLERTGNQLIQNPDQLIQKAFRSVEWTRLRRLLLNDYPKKDGAFTSAGLKQCRIDKAMISSQSQNSGLEI